MTVTPVLLAKTEYERWDKFCLESPQGSIFSTTDYIAKLTSKYSIVVCKNQNDDIVAGMALTKNELGFNKSPILVKYLGVLYSPSVFGNTSKEYQYANALIKYVSTQWIFDYNFHPSFNNWLPFYWAGYRQEVRYTYRIPLDNAARKGVESVYHSKLRNDIKYAIKNGVRVLPSLEPGDLFRMVSKTFERQGGASPISEQKIIGLFNNLSPTYYRIYGVESEQGLIAACAILIDSDSSYLVLNGIDKSKQVRGANSLLISHSINEMRGLTKWYDFEGSMIKEVEQFYRKYGGYLTPYYRIWKPGILNTLYEVTKTIYKRIRYSRA